MVGGCVAVGYLSLEPTQCYRACTLRPTHRIHGTRTSETKRRRTSRRSAGMSDPRAKAAAEAAATTKKAAEAAAKATAERAAMDEEEAERAELEKALAANEKRKAAVERARAAAICPPGSLVKGSGVIIHGLKSRDDLNGSIGAVVSFEDGRYAVRVSGTHMRIKADNLAPVRRKVSWTSDAPFVQVIQSCSVCQLAFLLAEFGPKMPELAENALMFACVIFSPEQVWHLNRRATTAPPQRSTTTTPRDHRVTTAWPSPPGAGGQPVQLVEPGRNHICNHICNHTRNHRWATRPTGRARATRTSPSGCVRRGTWRWCARCAPSRRTR